MGITVVVATLYQGGHFLVLQIGLHLIHVFLDGIYMCVSYQIIEFAQFNQTIMSLKMSLV